MIHKEKAKDLVNTFYYTLPNNGSQIGINSTTSRYEEAIRCALIAIDELIYAIQYLDGYDAEIIRVEYNKVRLEIQKRDDSKAIN
jgi:hypothetical protein